MMLVLTFLHRGREQSLLLCSTQMVIQASAAWLLPSPGGAQPCSAASQGDLLRSVLAWVRRRVPGVNMSELGIQSLIHSPSAQIPELCVQPNGHFQDTHNTARVGLNFSKNVFLAACV